MLARQRVEQFQSRRRRVAQAPPLVPNRPDDESLLAGLPELGRLNRGQVASLAGVAPMNRESGSQRGKRLIRGGRADPRNALYMAAWVAKNHDPKIRAYAGRLAAAGKPFKVIMTACMRKLLVILNVMLKTKTRWNETLLIGT